MRALLTLRNTDKTAHIVHFRWETWQKARRLQMSLKRLFPRDLLCPRVQVAQQAQGPQVLTRYTSPRLFGSG